MLHAAVREVRNNVSSATKSIICVCPAKMWIWHVTTINRAELCEVEMICTLAMQSSSFQVRGQDGIVDTSINRSLSLSLDIKQRGRRRRHFTNSNAGRPSHPAERPKSPTFAPLSWSGSVSPCYTVVHTPQAISIPSLVSYRIHSLVRLALQTLPVRLRSWMY